MSENYEETGAISPVAARLRGNGASEEGRGMDAHLRTTPHEERVARPAQAESHPQHPRPQEAAHPQAAAQTASRAWGNNCSLTPGEIKRAALERVQKKGDELGKRDVPSDMFDFMSRADVIFLDENNRPVAFERVIVAWEDG